MGLEVMVKLSVSFKSESELGFFAWKTLMRCWQLLGLVALMATVVCPTRADDSSDMREMLFDFFEGLGYLPVIVDRGYQIGDVINIDGVNLYARRERCFDLDKLKVPPKVPSSVPLVVSIESAGLNLGVRLRKILDFIGGADLVRRQEIKFTDVSVASVGLLDLRGALDRKTCPEIAPILDGTLEPLKSDEKTYFVVSEVMYGTTAVRVERASRGNVDVNTQELTRLAGSGDLAIHSTGDGFVTLEKKKVAPIALKPVTVPNVVKLASFEDGIRGAPQYKEKYEPVKCKSAIECRTKFGTFADRVKNVKVELPPFDILE